MLSEKNPTKAGDIRSFFPGNATSSKKGNGLENPSHQPKPLPGSAKKFNTPSHTTINAPKAGKEITPSNPFGSGEQLDPFRKPVMNNVRGFGDITNSASSSSVKPVKNPTVNNVFGFGDLSGHGTKKATGSGKPSGKGYVLGGSNSSNGKPPYRSGSFGGMLSNKGSGTFVLSGSSTKAKDSSTSADSTSSFTSVGKSTAVPSTSVQLFSGSGYVLGSHTSSNEVPKSRAGARADIQGLLIEKGNPSQKSTPIFTRGEVESLQIAEPGKRTSPSSIGNVKRPKTTTDTNSSHNVVSSTLNSASSVPCPVCNRKVLAELINNHLDDCIAAPAVAVKHPEDIIVLSDSDEEECQETKSHTECPCCNKKILESEINAHLSVCVSNSFDDEDDLILVEPHNNGKSKCPICAESILTADIDKHLENCASCSVQDLSGVFDENFSDDEEDAAVGSPSQQISESGERLFPCPCCLIMIESSKMNKHLDECLI